MTTALIVSLAYWVLILVYRFFANSMADQPIFVGPIIGLLLGDVMTGVAIGAALQIIYLGVVNVGGAQSTDTLYATCMAVALCIATGIPEEAAITLGIALGYIGLVMLQVTRIFFAFCAPWLDKVAETGDRRKYDRAYLVHIIIGYGFGAVTMFIALAAGADATQTFVNSLPSFVMTGLTTAAGLLPAIGLGVLLNMMWEKKKIIYIILGFALVAYLNVPTLCMAIIGVFLMLTELYHKQDLMKAEDKIEHVSAAGVGNAGDEEDFFND